MDLLKPRYTPSQYALVEKMRSRLNVARAVLMTRLERGLSQEEVAKLAGTKQSRISEIEASKGNVRFDTLDRVAGALDLMVELVPRKARADVFERGGYVVFVEAKMGETSVSFPPQTYVGFNQAVEVAA